MVGLLQDIRIPTTYKKHNCFMEIKNTENYSINNPVNLFKSSIVLYTLGETRIVSLR